MSGFVVLIGRVRRLTAYADGEIKVFVVPSRVERGVGLPSAAGKKRETAGGIRAQANVFVRADDAVDFGRGRTARHVDDRLLGGGERRAERQQQQERQRAGGIFFHLQIRPFQCFTA